MIYLGMKPTSCHLHNHSSLEIIDELKLLSAGWLLVRAIKHIPTNLTASVLLEPMSCHRQSLLAKGK